MCRRGFFLFNRAFKAKRFQSVGPAALIKTVRKTNMEPWSEDSFKHRLALRQPECNLLPPNPPPDSCLYNYLGKKKKNFFIKALWKHSFYVTVLEQTLRQVSQWLIGVMLRISSSGIITFKKAESLQSLSSLYYFTDPCYTKFICTLFWSLSLNWRSDFIFFLCLNFTWTHTHENKHWFCFIFLCIFSF